VVFESNRGSGDANVILATTPNQLQTVTTAPTEEVQPALSPEGRLAFASDRAGNFDIYATEHGTGGDRIQITSNTAPDYSPAWAPESGWLAFVSTRTGDADIYVIQAVTAAMAMPITNNLADDVEPAWSPRSLEIAFASNRAGTYDIWVVGFGRTVRRITGSSADDLEPAWSPDGHTLAFTRRKRGSLNYDIYTLDLQAGLLRRLTSDSAEDSEPTWSPDGTQIAFVSDRDGDYDVYVMNEDGSDEKNLSDNEALFDLGPNWMPPVNSAIASLRPAALVPTTVRRREAPTITCEIKGRPGKAIEGTSGNDKICGTDGKDIIYGRGGDDEIVGGKGKDTIYGGYGNDIIDAREGRDRVFGGPGKDKVKSRDGSRDRIRGGQGSDRARTDGRKLDKGRWEAKL
jgi:Tol biopolymer transport system component